MSKTRSRRQAIWSAAFTGFCATLISVALISAPPTTAHGQAAPLPIGSDQLQFTYGSQDGGFSFPCRHEISHPVLLDWDVRCADPARPVTERRFTVHLRVFSFVRPVAPKTAYQILFEVTNHAIPIGQQGRYVGSSMWFRFEDKAPMRSLEISENIENTTSLEMRLNLK